MQFMLRTFVLLIILSASVFSACTGQISQLVPAVVGENGGMVNVTMHLVPGPGKEYTAIYPRIGTMTQESMQNAVAYAYYLSQKSPACSLLIDFDAQSHAEFIDGPSAGAVMTVMAYALINNQTIRSDAVLTGALGSSGIVEPVGGLYEKSKGAAVAGAKYFIAPVGSVYESLLLKNVEQSQGIKILRVKTIEELIGFMLFNRSIEQTTVNKNRTIPNLPKYNSSDIVSFIPVAQKMIDNERDVASKLLSNDEQTRGLKDFFGNEINRQTALLKQGYLFSAANEAFLNFIEVSTINSIPSPNLNLKQTKSEIEFCLNNVKRPSMSDQNFEWIIGSDLRIAWAINKLNKTNIENNSLVEEKFVKYNELMYSRAWCNVASALAANTPDSGSRITEDQWKSTAADLLSIASAKPISDDDLRSRLEIAQNSYQNRHYGAAIYDAVYVSTMQLANQEGSAKNETELRSYVLASLNETRYSLWGKLYQSQAAFLVQEKEFSSAYRILRLSKALDEVTMRMASVAQPEVGNNSQQSLVIQPVVSESDSETTNRNQLFFLAGIVVVLFVILAGILILLTKMKGGKYGSNMQGRSGIYRTNQKKGRA